MKRELKPVLRARGGLVQGPDCKAYPDEKGIETVLLEILPPYLIEIAKPIPMKRELKR